MAAVFKLCNGSWLAVAPHHHFCPYKFIFVMFLEHKTKFPIQKVVPFHKWHECQQYP